MKCFYTRRNFTIQYKILNFFGPSLSLSPLHNFNLLTQSEAVYEDFIFFFSTYTNHNIPHTLTRCRDRETSKIYIN